MDVWGGVGGVRDGERITLPITAVLYAKSLQSHPTLCDPMDHSPPGSSVHGILQQEHWSELSCPPPGHLPNLWIKPVSLVCCMGRQVLYHWCHLGSSHATYHPSNLDWEKCYLETHAPESWAAQVSTGLARPHPFGPMLFTFTKLCFTLVLLDYITSTS